MLPPTGVIVFIGRLDLYHSAFIRKTVGSSILRTRWWSVQIKQVQKRLFLSQGRQIKIVMAHLKKEKKKGQSTSELIMHHTSLKKGKSPTQVNGTKNRHLSDLNKENGIKWRDCVWSYVDYNMEEFDKCSCVNCFGICLFGSHSEMTQAEHLSGLWRVLRDVSHFAQIQLAQVRGAEGAQVQVAVVLVCLADVGRHHAVRVVKATNARPTVL